MQRHRIHIIISHGHPIGTVAVIPTGTPSSCKTLVELVQNKMQIRIRSEPFSSHYNVSCVIVNQMSLKTKCENSISPMFNGGSTCK